jgi:hypothetical protein
MSNKRFIYGIGEVTFNGKQLGYIEKGSWDWGGTKPESTDIEAEQVPDAPVLVLANKNGSISPTFNLIQLDYENLHLALGGELVGSEGAYTGWKAPTSVIQLSGAVVIKFASGQKCTIPNAQLLSNLSGKLTLTEVSKIECQLKVMKPENGGAPYEIADITED